jgi:hypothetical protein
VATNTNGELMERRTPAQWLDSVEGLLIEAEKAIVKDVTPLGVKLHFAQVAIAFAQAQLVLDADDIAPDLLGYWESHR